MKRRTMTADEYRDAIKRLGLNQTSAAPVLGITIRTSQRYAEKGGPVMVRRLLEYIERYGDTLD